MTDTLRPALSGLQLRTAQQIWFSSWNEAVRRARAAYEIRLEEIAEKDRAARLWHERQYLREARVVPELCRAGTHKTAEVGVYWDKKGWWRCRGCTNDRSTQVRRAKGILPRRRFNDQQGADLRTRYEAGARLEDLTPADASMTAVRNAIRWAGGTIRTAQETKRLRQAGEQNA